MEKNLLNFLKKLGQHEPIIIGSAVGKELYKKTYIYIKEIIPNRVILDKNAFRITHLDKMFYLDGFEVTTENDRVKNVKIFGNHPNSDTVTDIFCLPDFKKGVFFTDKYLNLIFTNIQTYYLDNCYFNPTGKELRYEKMKSIYVQFNK